jgi:LacI family transcriptional regulator
MDIRSIAKHLGISISTVSSVITGRGYVSPHMRARVEEYLRQVDYQPNYVARSLRKRESRIVGFIMPDMGNHFYCDLSRGAEDYLSSQDYRLVVSDSREDWERQREYLMSFSRMMIDGVILVPSLGTDAQIESIPTLARNLPIVYVDRSPPIPPVDAVMIDNVQASADVTRYLIGLGHRRIGILTESLNLLSAIDRLAGYQYALRDCGLEEDSSLIYCGGNTKELAHLAALRMLDHPQPPSAAIICNNPMTLGVLAALRERGINCPAQFSIIGFDDSEWSEYLDPPLTTVHQPALEMGAVAAEILLNRLRNTSPRPPATTHLRYRLIERGSSAPPSERT